MKTIQVFDYQKDSLDRIAKHMREIYDLPLVTYSDVIGYLTRNAEIKMGIVDNEPVDTAVVG